MSAEPQLRNRLVLSYVGALLVVWFASEVRWWWWGVRWRANVAVPWDVRRSFDWAPPGTAVRGRRRR